MVFDDFQDRFDIFVDDLRFVMFEPRFAENLRIDLRGNGKFTRKRFHVNAFRQEAARRRHAVAEDVDIVEHLDLCSG